MATHETKTHKCTAAHRGRMAGAKKREADKTHQHYPIPNLPIAEYPPREPEWIEQYQIGYYDFDDIYPNQYANSTTKPRRASTFIPPSKEEAIDKYQNAAKSRLTRDRSANRTQVTIRLTPAIANAARNANINVSRVCEDALAQIVATITS